MVGCDGVAGTSNCSDNGLLGSKIATSPGRREWEMPRSDFMVLVDLDHCLLRGGVLRRVLVQFISCGRPQCCAQLPV